MDVCLLGRKYRRVIGCYVRHAQRIPAALTAAHLLFKIIPSLCLLVSIAKLNFEIADSTVSTQSANERNISSGKKQNMAAGCIGARLTDSKDGMLYTIKKQTAMKTPCAFGRKCLTKRMSWKKFIRNI